MLHHTEVIFTFVTLANIKWDGKVWIYEGRLQEQLRGILTVSIY